MLPLYRIFLGLIKLRHSYDVTQYYFLPLNYTKLIYI